MKALLVLIACVGLSFGAVEGIVTNQTTGKPQGGVSVTLIELGTGMKNIGTVKSGADGKFTLATDLAPGSPHLVQAQHQGVNYNRILPPGTGGAGLTLEVYDSSSTPRDAQVSQDMFLLEPSGTEMAVSERIVFTNSGKYTYEDPAGTIKFYVPEGVSRDIQVRIQAPQGMPITRPAEKGKDPNTYVVRYPMKPGETNIDIAYALPMTSNEAKFAGKVLHGGGPVRFVVPTGVKLDGPFEDSGPIPGTGATAYTLKAATEFALTVTGTGSLRASAPSGGGEGGSGEEQGPSIVARKPLIYDKLNWVLPLAFAMLAVGFTLLYRRPVPVRPGGQR